MIINSNWAGATWMSGWVAPNGQRIQKQIPWMGEQDLLGSLEEVCGDD